MKRALLGFGVVAAVIGCAGGGVSTFSTTATATTTGTVSSGSTTGTVSTGTTTTGSTGGNFAVIPSSTPGQFDVNVITGFGRAATVSVDLGQISFARLVGSPLTSSFSPIRIGLDGYTHDLVNLSTGLVPAAQDFDEFTFRIDKLILPGNVEINGPVSTSRPIRARTGRGRVAAFRLLLDDSMIYEDTGAIIVDSGQFDASNIDPYGGVLACFYSDFVRLDISGLAQKPQLSGGGDATYVYLSGDLYGLSGASASSFEAFFGIGRNLDTVAQRSGSFTTAGTSGTYQLDETDPNDPNATLKRLEGTWTDAGNVLENIGGFAMIAFPSCDSEATDQVLMISLSGGTISECFIGELNTDDATFVAYPVSELGSLAPSLIGGTIVDSSAGGTFTIEFGTKPGSFPDSGSYVRFIR